MSNITYFGYPGIPKDANGMTKESIVGAVCKWYDISLDNLMVKGRQRKIVEARQVAMYLLRRRTQMTLLEIGNYFNGRDHTTVVHSVKKIEDLKHSYPDFKIQIQRMLESF